MSSCVTRGSATLDIIATNFANHVELDTFFPLETFNSESTSDHLSIVGKAKMENIHLYTTNVYQTRKYTQEAEDAFGSDLAAVDWAQIVGSTPSDSANKLDFILQFLYNKHFPLRTVKSRSCDPPWLTKRIKRYIRNRKREYARSGRSARWKKKKEKCERMIEEAKKAYLERVKKG